MLTFMVKLTVQYLETSSSALNYGKKILNNTHIEYGNTSVLTCESTFKILNMYL